MAEELYSKKIHGWELKRGPYKLTLSLTGNVSVGEDSIGSVSNYPLEETSFEHYCSEATGLNPEFILTVRCSTEWTREIHLVSFPKCCGILYLAIELGYTVLSLVCFSHEEWFEDQPGKNFKFTNDRTGNKLTVVNVDLIGNMS